MLIASVVDFGADSDSASASDERGFTLQALIVTAVLLLLPVALVALLLLQLRFSEALGPRLTQGCPDTTSFSQETEATSKDIRLSPPGWQSLKIESARELLASRWRRTRLSAIPTTTRATCCWARCR